MSYALAQVAGAASVQRSSLPLGEQLPTTFTPHVGIGQVRGRKRRQALLDELPGGWQPVSFRVSEAHFIVRDDPLQKCRQQAIALQATRQAAMAASVRSEAPVRSLTSFYGLPWFWVVFARNRLTDVLNHSNILNNVGIHVMILVDPVSGRSPVNCSCMQLSVHGEAPGRLEKGLSGSRTRLGGRDGKRGLLGGKSAIRSPESRTATSLHNSRG